VCVCKRKRVRRQVREIVLRVDRSQKRAWLHIGGCDCGWVCERECEKVIMIEVWRDNCETDRE
jgi:hypothetical protein